MKLRTAVIALTLAVLPLGAACSGSDDGGGTSVASTSGSVAIKPPAGGTIPDSVVPRPAVKYQLVFGQDGCQRYEAPGLKTIPGVYCVRKAPDNQYAWDFYFQRGFSVSSKPVFRQEYGPANVGYNVQRYYPNGIWTRSPVSDPAVVEFCWQATVQQACTWATPAVYRQLVDQQTQLNKLNTQAAAQAKQVQTQSAQAQQSNRQQAQALLNDLQLREIKMGELWTQPACNSSYNGCR